MPEYVTVPSERAGLELDEFLCLLYPEWSKGYLRRQVREGRILVDGMDAQPSQRLRRHQVLILELDEDADPPPPSPVAPPTRVGVLYEDEHCLVVDKPPGLAVEPERWAKESASLAGAALELARAGAGARAEAGAALPYRPRLVHRIDKGTSGAVLLAKHLAAERALRRAFEEGRMHKRYLALVEGEHPLQDGESMVIDRPLGPEPRRGGRMRVDASGKPSRTRVEVAERFRGYTWVRCEPLTGRTHQIRVHLASEGFPLAVDPQYGRRDELLLSNLKANYRAKPGRTERPLLDRLSLHAAEVGWREPLELSREEPAPGESLPYDESRASASAGAGALAPLTVEAPLPKDLARTLKQLAKVRPPAPGALGRAGEYGP